ncbi:MAG: tRNA (guanosine(46)-N7)-methyltransferase TrmB [Sulfurovum sp.]|nr:tRNA (guanosine(46)-N7)-methyltransferase TrmB [Sulfurovum sp.]
MPHLKVKPFDSNIIATHIATSTVMTFVATAIHTDDILIGISHQDESFLLQLKPDKEGFLLKYDKVTRPLKVNILKEALAIVAQELALEIQSSNITISSTKVVPSSEYLKKIEDFVDIQYPKDTVSVEVGFGSGKHLLYQAQKNPDTLFIGLEIHTPSAQQVLKQIALQNIQNIWVVNYDARLFLEMLPSNLCKEIFVHFPVPWDKKPLRRVISKSFLSESMRVLAVDGRLELRTDSDNYFWYALETFFSVPQTSVEIRKNEALEVTSKYEARWLRQEKDIYDVYVKSKALSTQIKEPIVFDFYGIHYTEGIEETLAKEALVYEGYFVHFERIFRISAKRLLIKCAFGSFDRPEHKYVLLAEESCTYFVSPPVQTKVNLMAHEKLIMQFLPQHIALKDNNV